MPFGLIAVSIMSATLPPAFSIDSFAPLVTLMPSTFNLDERSKIPKILTFLTAF